MTRRSVFSALAAIVALTGTARAQSPPENVILLDHINRGGVYSGI